MKKKLLWVFAAVGSCLMMAAGASAAAQVPGWEAEVEEARNAGGTPVGPGLWRLAGEDPEIGSTDDLAPLRRIIGKATVVGLGESWHMSGGFYDMKHRIFRDLVENMGFRVFAIESHWASGEKANRYVQTCEGSPREAIDLHISVWQSEELADLVQWMCEWNQAHPDDRVHYYGFDIQLPHLDGPGLIAFLGRIGVPEGHPWVAGIRQCEGVTAYHYPTPIAPAAHEQCLAALAEVEEHFQANRRSIQEQTSKEDLDLASLRLLSVRAFEDSAFYIGSIPFLGGGTWARGFNARDVAMAEVFFLLKEKHFPKARAVVWAANIHVARAPIAGEVRPMGSVLAARLGSKYVSFALAAYRADLDAGRCVTRDAVPGSVEERLQALGEDALLVDLGRSTYLKPRALYEMGTVPVQPRRHFNGIVFLEHSARMHPTSWPACRP